MDVVLDEMCKRQLDLKLARVVGAACISLFSVCVVNTSSGQVGFGDANHPRVELVKLFQVGDENSPDDLIIGNIQGIAVNSAGELFIADRGEQAVFVISEAGRLVDRFGRMGEGPGEFERIGGLFIGPGDSIYVHDFGRYRLTVFEPEERKYAYSLNIANAEEDRYYATALLGVVGNGYVYRYGEGISFDPERDWNVDRIVLRVYHVGRDGNVGQLILSLPDNDVVVFFEGGPGISPLPFGRSAHVRVGPNGRVYSGRNDSLSISITNTSGEVEGSIRLELRLEPVTRADVQESLAGRSASRQRQIRDIGIPDTKPAYSTFRVDDRGRIWVRGRTTADDALAPWLIVDKTGSVTGRALLPRNVSLRVIKSDKAYAMSSEESGAPIVIVYEIKED